MNYLEACKAVVAELDVDAIAALPLGETVGNDGHSYGFRQLGEIATVSAESVSVGVKIPKIRLSGAWFDVTHAIGFIDLASIKAPELLGYVPSFVGLIAVEGSPVTAVLTEDVSLGGKKGVFPRAVSQEVRALLARTFGEHSFHTEACHKSVAFDVGGQEKLLDLTPPPIEHYTLRQSEAYGAAQEKAADALNDLTITVPRDSALGSGLGSITLA